MKILATPLMLVYSTKSHRPLTLFSARKNKHLSDKILSFFRSSLKKGHPLVAEQQQRAVRPAMEQGNILTMFKTQQHVGEFALVSA